MDAEDGVWADDAGSGTSTRSRPATRPSSRWRRAPARGRRGPRRRNDESDPIPMNVKPARPSSATPDASRSRIPAALPFARGRDHPVERGDEPRVVELGPGRPGRATGRPARRTARRRRRSPRVASDASTAARDSTWNTPATRGLRSPRSARGRSSSSRRRGSRRHAPDPGRRVAHPGQRLARSRPPSRGAGSSARPRRGRAIRPDPRSARRTATRTTAAVGVAWTATSWASRSVSVRHAVLEVDQRPVEARPRDDVGRDDRAEVERRADGRLAREDPAAEVRARGNRRERWSVRSSSRPWGDDAGWPSAAAAAGVDRPVLDPAVRADGGERRHEVDDRADVVGHDRDDLAGAGRRAAGRRSTIAVVVVHPLDHRARPAGIAP